MNKTEKTRNDRNLFLFFELAHEKCAKNVKKSPDLDLALATVIKSVPIFFKNCQNCHSNSCS